MDEQLKRRKFLGMAARAAGAAVLGGVTWRLLEQSRTREGKWVIDNDACSACGHCETHCVHEKSAVVCRNRYEDCGMCKYCYGYEVRDDDPFSPVNTGDNNLVCKTGALQRRTVHVCDESRGVDEYRYEYAVNEELCTGCGACVKRCREHGNNTLYLVVRDDRCAGCNECSIARSCKGRSADGGKAMVWRV